ncbi:unnamed protein product, partial [Phaeothamnion confervicola]
STQYSTVYCTVQYPAAAMERATKRRCSQGSLDMTPAEPPAQFFSLLFSSSSAFEARCGGAEAQDILLQCLRGSGLRASAISSPNLAVSVHVGSAPIPLPPGAGPEVILVRSMLGTHPQQDELEGEFQAWRPSHVLNLFSQAIARLDAMRGRSASSSAAAAAAAAAVTAPATPAALATDTVSGLALADALETRAEALISEAVAAHGSGLRLGLEKELSRIVAATSTFAAASLRYFLEQTRLPLHEIVLRPAAALATTTMTTTVAAAAAGPKSTSNRPAARMTLVLQGDCSAVKVRAGTVPSAAAAASEMAATAESDAAGVSSAAAAATAAAAAAASEAAAAANSAAAVCMTPGLLAVLEGGPPRLADLLLESFWQEMVRGGYHAPEALRAAAGPPLRAYFLAGVERAGGIALLAPAAFCPRRSLSLYLQGPAGAGKTAFARGMGAALAAAIQRWCDAGAPATAALVVQALNKPLGRLAAELAPRPNNNDTSTMGLAMSRRQTLAQAKPGLVCISFEEVPPTAAAAPAEASACVCGRSGVGGRYGGGGGGGSDYNGKAHHPSSNHFKANLDGCRASRGRGRCGASSYCHSASGCGGDSSGTSSGGNGTGVANDAESDSDQRVEQAAALELVARRFQHLSGDASLIAVFTSNYDLCPASAVALRRVGMFQHLVVMPASPLAGAERRAFALAYADAALQRALPRALAAAAAAAMAAETAAVIATAAATTARTAEAVLAATARAVARERGRIAAAVVAEEAKRTPTAASAASAAAVESDAAAGAAPAAAAIQVPALRGKVLQAEVPLVAGEGDVRLLVAQLRWAVAWAAAEAVRAHRQNAVAFADFGVRICCDGDISGDDMTIETRDKTRIVEVWMEPAATAAAAASSSSAIAGNGATSSPATGAGKVAGAAVLNDHRKIAPAYVRLLAPASSVCGNGSFWG